MKSEIERFEKKAEKKAQSREKKKRPEMKVSGKNVFKLQEMMRKDSKS